MRQHLATLSSDGVWLSGGGDQLAMLSGDPVDQIVAMLGQIVMRTQGLPEADRSRVREFVRIAGATLSATTCLPQADQATFEQALRNARK